MKKIIEIEIPEGFKIERIINTDSTNKIYVDIQPIKKQLEVWEEFDTAEKCRDEFNRLFGRCILHTEFSLPNHFENHIHAAFNLYKIANVWNDKSNKISSTKWTLKNRGDNSIKYTYFEGNQHIIWFKTSGLLEKSYKLFPDLWNDYLMIEK
jgi:hypothetical protein